MQHFINDLTYELQFFLTDVAPTAVVFVGAALLFTAGVIAFISLLAYLLA